MSIAFFFRNSISPMTFAIFPDVEADCVHIGSDFRERSSWQVGEAGIVFCHVITEGGCGCYAQIGYVPT